MIWKDEIEEARIDMGEYASEMSDQEIEDILRQIKKMAIYVVNFMEREQE
jgi:hypothetical protein